MMKAIVTDPQAVGHLVIGEVEQPTPGPGQALVRVV
jgi:NADPH:quinone reductase-like Zn-dependent oxidoreductase